MLIDKLQIEIHESRGRLDPQTDIVIMHPDTFKEMFGSSGAHMAIILHGCTIYRSEDVPKNEFVIR